MIKAFLIHPIERIPILNHISFDITVPNFTKFAPLKKCAIKIILCIKINFPYYRLDLSNNKYLKIYIVLIYHK